METTAGCYRSFQVNSVAPGDERKPSAPRTAARASPRPGTRHGDLLHRQQGLRRGKRPHPKLRNPTTQERLPAYRATTRCSHRQTNGQPVLKRLRKLHMKKNQAPKSSRNLTLSVIVTKLQTLHTTCGGLGRADEKDILYYSLTECL